MHPASRGGRGAGAYWYDARVAKIETLFVVRVRFACWFCLLVLLVRVSIVILLKGYNIFSLFLGVLGRYADIFLSLLLLYIVSCVIREGSLCQAA